MGVNSIYAAGWGILADLAANFNITLSEQVCLNEGVRVRVDKPSLPYYRVYLVIAMTNVNRWNDTLADRSRGVMVGNFGRVKECGSN